MTWRRGFRYWALVLVLSVLGLLLMQTAGYARGINDLVRVPDLDCWDDYYLPGASAPPFGLGEPIGYENWCDPIYTS
jgi:hypothetical protein